jgi:hypothetical protein
MNDPADDPLGAELGRVLNNLAAVPASQDLAAAYSRIGSQLADAGRQDAGELLGDIAKDCADAAARAEVPSDLRTETVTREALARLHIEGLKTDERSVREAVAKQLDKIRAGEQAAVSARKRKGLYEKLRNRRVKLTSEPPDQPE